jgi:hypothetical protein
MVHKIKLFFMLIILLGLLFASLQSCTTYSKGCDGNKRMLTAGSGYTKFRK